MASKVHIQRPPPVEAENGLLFVKVQATGDSPVLGVYAQAYRATEPPPTDISDPLNSATTDVWEGRIGYPNVPFKVRVRAEIEADDPMAPPIQVFSTSIVFNPP